MCGFNLANPGILLVSIEEVDVKATQYVFVSGEQNVQREREIYNKTRR
jgi:hypothetical protein